MDLKLRRVVVTGLGAVTPVGMGVEAFWESLVKGASGIGKITRFDTSRHECQIAAEVRGFDPLAYVERKDVKKMDLFVHYSLAAGLMAIQDSGLKIDDSNRERIGVFVGTGMGGLPVIEEMHKVLLERGPGRISAFFVPSIITNMASGQLSMRLGLKGPNSCVSTACATGSHAIGDSFKIIQRGDADVMLAGGSEAVITPLTIGGFAAMKALSTRNHEPEKASRPFDRERDGFVIGEGAGIVVLEALEHALARGARIYAEVKGYGMSADAYHVTAPAPNGEGAVRAMRMALKDARLNPREIDYINAHATSTPAGDLNESQAIKAVFGEDAYRIPVSSIKSMTGHLLGAAGGIEVVATVLTILHGIIPPTINYEYPDPDCDLDYVPNKCREADVRVAISNSFGFGGTNATLVLQKYEE